VVRLVADSQGRGPLLRALATFTQLGFDLAVPPVLCIWLASWLQQRFALGKWVILVGIIVGLMGTAGGMMEFYQRVLRDGGSSDQKE